jgi:hypothetical protein
MNRAIKILNKLSRAGFAFIALFLLLSNAAKAQIDTVGYEEEDSILTVDTTAYTYTEEGEVLLEEAVDYDFHSEYGPNGKNFFQGYSGFAFMVGPSDTGVAINYGLSSEQFLGWRYKRRLSGMFSLVGDMGFRAAQFNISQPKGNYFLDTTFWHRSGVEHRKEKIGYYSLDLGAFVRINFDPRRGDNIGRYLDLGATGSYLFSNRYVTIDEQREARVKTRFTRFPYMNPLQYELTGKLGFNIIAIVAKCRMTDIFKPQYNFPEFPRYLIGLEISSLE